MVQWWVILLILSTSLIPIGIGSYKLIRYYERKVREKNCNELHKMNNSKFYMDSDGVEKQDDTPIININNDLEISLHDRLRLEGDAIMVREGIRSLRFFKKTMLEIKNNAGPEDLNYYLEKENEIRSRMIKSLNNLKVKMVDVTEIEKYIENFGKPDEW